MSFQIPYDDASEDLAAARGVAACPRDMVKVVGLLHLSLLGALYTEPGVI